MQRVKSQFIEFIDRDVKMNDACVLLVQLVKERFDESSTAPVTALILEITTSTTTWELFVDGENASELPAEIRPHVEALLAYADKQSSEG